MNPAIQPLSGDCLPVTYPILIKRLYIQAPDKGSIQPRLEVQGVHIHFACIRPSKAPGKVC